MAALDTEESRSAVMACGVWLRRDFLIRHGREPEEPPCGHDPHDCPPAADIPADERKPA